eukprot:TRINITY_DN16774_c0_g1_i1.p1 TRINITY_DN16774_c0_g1~~TRINITY_DN16774_c0_g1_i1.p1  ORF type:complete len:1263 (-),score=355.73 TRINITY_DN16774_c0_g1_i1:101-3778(-)
MAVAGAEGSVREVILENFKSYGGRNRIGPLQKFTCVVGPNGAGKSNLVDAIAFVLCAGRRRGFATLVHRTEAEGADASRRAGRVTAVELVYVRGDAAPDEEPEIVFRRALRADAQACVYSVSGQELSESDFVARLEGVNILSKARNFLVFQGDVEAAAQRRGKDLVHFFEQISGSLALREEYDRLAAEKSRLEESARHLFHRKRSALNEKKFLSEQKAEADRYVRLETNFRRLQVEFYLFRLQAEAAERARAAAEERRASLQAPLEAARQQLTAAQRARERAHLAANQASRESAAERARFERLGPELVAAKSRLAAAQQRLEDLRQKAESERKRRERLQEQLNTLARDRDLLLKQLEEQEAKLREELPFSAEQRAEFETAQVEARKATAASGAQARDLEAQLRTISRDRGRAEQELREAHALREHLANKTAELRERRSEIRLTLERSERVAGEMARRFTNLQETVGRAEAERKELLAKREEMYKTIQDITAAEHQIKHERNLAKISADLARAVPGVRGRVLENCRPADARFAVAVNVVLGGYMDAVVTDTAEAARECVRYLKQHMLRPMLFLPMDSLRVPAEDPRLQELVRSDGSGALHVAINCIEFDPVFRDVFRFMLGDVVFAADLETATRVAFGPARARGVGCRFVSLFGETISREGNIAVSSEAVGATRFDFVGLSGQREELEALDRRLRELHSIEAAGGGDRSRLREQLQSAESRQHEDKQRLERCESELEAREKELAAAEAARAQRQSEAERLVQDETTGSRELRALEESIGQSVRAHFQRLNEAFGCDVQKMEREFRKAREAAHSRRSELSQQLGSLTAETAMVQQTFQERASQDYSAAIASCEGELPELRAAVDRLAGETGGRQAAAENASRAANVGLDAEQNAELELVKRRHALREAQQGLGESEKELLAATASLQALQEAKTDMLRHSLLEDVEVPLLEGGQAGVPVVDFSMLPEEKRAAATGPAARLLEEEYRCLLRSAAAELERARPNLKSIEQLSSATEQAQDATQDAAAAHREIEEVKRSLAAIREERRVLFMSCFNKVEKEINVVYNALTRQHVHGGLREGGSAFLDIEDLDEPYNGGMRFSVMPPSKRITDLGLLSGGERAIAALALLFAVQAYQRPPLLVLDEVDAHLDAAGVRALATYVASRGLQTLVVSLRGAFCASSQALVGVSKDPVKESSIVLTLDLGQFRTRPALAGSAAPSPQPLMAAATP